MTEKSWGWTTGTAGDGTSTYTQSDYAEQMKVIAHCLGFEGVAPNYLNSLAVTGASSPVSVNTGGAMVDGHPYKNDASMTVAIPTPVTNSRIDRIVLRASWSPTYTVRVTRIAGTENVSPTAPAITQSSGSTYDIKLAQVLITTGGVCTVTDERTWAQAGGANTMAAQTVTAAQIASILLQRQGGNSTNWNISGTTNYTPSLVKVYAGVINWSGGAANSGSVTVTFPAAFSALPMGIACPATGNWVYSAFVPQNSSSASIQWNSPNSYATIDFGWVAIGPA